MRFFYRIQYVFVTGAAAEVAGDESAKFFAGVFLSGADNFDGGHDEAGCAESALYGCFVDEGLLYGGEFAIWAFESFNGQDMVAIGPNGEKDAGVNGSAVEENCACAAFSGFTSFFDAGQAEAVSECIGK